MGDRTEERFFRREERYIVKCLQMTDVLTAPSEHYECLLMKQVHGQLRRDFLGKFHWTGRLRSEMNPRNKTAIRSMLFALGFRAIRQTKAADVLDLMQKLRPQDCGIDLIRIGSSGDGGYLIPDDLEGIEYCFSPGVSTVADFENHLADLHIRSYLADYSVTSPPIDRPEFTFDKKFLGSSDRENYFTLASWKAKYLQGYTGDLILQMDIEGSEYEVILSLPDSLLDQFRIMVIEFHHLDRLFDPFAFRLISSCFERLRGSFHVVHIHPNSQDGSLRCGDLEVPRSMEFTFLNKKRVGETKPHVAFPHKLDTDNLPGTSLALPKCWYL